jgi:cell division protein FtsN
LSIDILSEQEQKMVETYQSSKHDKMISLIAWLIVGSLLFYLAVYTFESFLRKSPYQEIIQQVGNKKTEVSPADAGSTVVASVRTEDKPESVILEPVEKNVSSETPLPEVAAEDSITAAAIEPAAQKVEPASELTVETVVVPETKVVQDVPVSQVELSEVNAVSVVDPSLMVSAGEVFPDIEEVFRFMKQIDYGEEDIRADVVETKDGFMVFFLSPAPEISQAARLENYLKMRNHGLKLSIRQMPERAIPLSGAEQPKETVKDTETVQKTEVLSNTELQDNFQYNAQFKPFTIQIGAFNSRERAESLMSEMSGRGYNSLFIEEKTLSGVANFRVLLGNFSSQREASIYATGLSEKENVPVYARSFL